MSRGNRPGRRRRGREAPASSESGERLLVLPGEELPVRDLRPGHGTYRTGGKIYASILGLLSRRPPFVQVVPLSGRYIPHPHDVVIGTVTDVQSTFWLLDISAPRWAPLHMTGTPWKVEVGETGQYLRVGDSVVVQVESLEATGRIGVTMVGEGLGKLEGGTIVRISPARVARVIGRGGSMLQTITRHTGAQVAVGQNGRVWVGGSPDAIQRVSEVLRTIEEDGQRPGLTERVESFLLATRTTDEHGPRASSPDDAPRGTPSERYASADDDEPTEAEDGPADETEPAEARDD